MIKNSQVTGSSVKSEEYPEHEKLHAVVEESQVCGEFLEWLQSEKGFSICRHVTDEERDARDSGGFWEWNGQELVPAPFVLHELLAEFFEIDLEKLEEEKLQMLKVLRGQV